MKGKTTKLTTKGVPGLELSVTVERIADRSSVVGLTDERREATTGSVSLPELGKLCEGENLHQSV